MKFLVLGFSMILPISSFAADIVTSPYQLVFPCYEGRSFGGYSRAFCLTLEMTDNFFGNPMERASVFKIFAYTLALPFVILDEEAHTLKVDENFLLDQGYSQEEVIAFYGDLEITARELSKNKIESESDAINLINQLKGSGKLSTTTLEIMGL